MIIIATNANERTHSVFSFLKVDAAAAARARCTTQNGTEHYYKRSVVAER
jgi:hypothetical protein